MAFSPQEIEMLLTGAANNYLFKFAFESRNPGCEFDMDSWVNELNEIASSNELNIMNKATADKLTAVLNDLDRFAKKKENSVLIEN